MESTPVCDAVSLVVCDTLSEAAGDIADHDVRLARGIGGLALLIHQCVVCIERVHNDTSCVDVDGIRASSGNSGFGIIIPSATLYEKTSVKFQRDDMEEI